MPSAAILKHWLNSAAICPIVDFDRSIDKVVQLDFTNANTELSNELLDDIDRFSEWVEKYISSNGARYGIGGYNEHRTIYRRSAHFDTAEEPRRLHLGTDIWAPVSTPIYSPLNATVHSFKMNNNFGDYGATIILQHELGSEKFYSLYGHLSLDSIKGLIKGQAIKAGEQLATLGNIDENGNWPPHLHFQLIYNLESMEGDYPGVCKFYEKDYYLKNCPDPDIILRHTF